MGSDRTCGLSLVAHIESRAKLTGKQIAESARSIVLANPGGIRYVPLVKQIHESSVETSKNAIAAQVVGLVGTFPNEISRPSRGLFMAAGQIPDGDAITTKAEQTTLSESYFYQPFADWLKG